MKKDQPEFKRHFYLNWFVQDWLGDQNLKLCPPEVKGFWMDLLMQMVLSFPFGHLSRLSRPRMRESDLPLVKQILVGTLVHQKSKKSVHQDSEKSVDQEDDQWVRLSVGLSLKEQLSLAVNLEEKIPELTGYQPENVQKWLAILDDLNVFSRTPEGIIYNRRMVKDFQKRKIAFINACRGVNIYEVKSRPRKDSIGLVYQNTDQSIDQDADQSTDQDGGQVPGQGNGQPLHQIPSNSNSNSNSSYSLSNKESIQTDSNGSSLGNTENGTKEKEGNGVSLGSGSGPGNGQFQKIDFTGLKSFKDRLVEDHFFLDPILCAAPPNVDKETISAWLDLFNLHCVMSRKLEKDYGEYVSHFRYWIYKVDTSKKPPNAKTVSEVAKSKKMSTDLLSKYSAML